MKTSLSTAPIKAPKVTKGGLPLPRKLDHTLGQADLPQLLVFLLVLIVQDSTALAPPSVLGTELAGGVEENLLFDRIFAGSDRWIVDAEIFELSWDYLWQLAGRSVHRCRGGSFSS